MSAWSNLPNAEHIDAVLADLGDRPLEWARAWRQLADLDLVRARGAVMVADQISGWAPSRSDEYALARRSAINLTEVSSRFDILTKAERAVRGADMTNKLDIVSTMAARAVALDAMRALVAWDESATLLSLAPGELRTIISTHDGGVRHQAVLLLPAVMARQSSDV